MVKNGGFVEESHKFHFVYGKNENLGKPIVCIFEKKLDWI